MNFDNQTIIPASRTMKQFEKLLSSRFDYIVLLEVHLGQLVGLKREADKHKKKLIIHADLIHGLKTDQYAAEFLCNEIKPAGIISTRSNFILKAKEKGIIAIQRMFLIDTIALEKSFALIEQTNPDFIELLPGIIPEMIREVNERTGIPIITGGLMKSIEQVEEALNAGAIAISTSNKDLWIREIVKS